MVVPFVALILVLGLIAYFAIGAAKRKTEGKDMGDSRAGTQRTGGQGYSGSGV